MFESLNVGNELYSDTVAVATTTTPVQLPRPEVGNLVIVIEVRGRTAGTCALVLQASATEGGTYRPLEAAYQATRNSNGITYFYVTSPLASWLRLSLTPAGGFDGTVTLTMRAGNWLVADGE